MLENRSFDHYLNGVPGSEYERNGTNPDPDPNNPSGEIAQCHESDFCLKNPPHEWGATHLQYDNGHVDGFVATGGRKSMAYYDEGDLGPIASFC
jgi:phospholipase C